MLNDKGVTLVEMLAAIALLGIVFAVGALLLTQTGSLLNNATLSATDRGAVNQTVKTVRGELSQASAVYVAGANELRYRKNFIYYAFCMTDAPSGSAGSPAKSLTRYEFGDDYGSAVSLTEAQIAAAEADFTDSSITCAAQPGKYRSAVRLPGRLREVAFYAPAGAAGEFAPAGAGTLLSAGNFRVDLVFADRRVDAGASAATDKAGPTDPTDPTVRGRGQRSVVVNLLSDTIE